MYQLTDADIGLLCLNSYLLPPGAFDRVINVDGVFVCVRNLPDQIAIIGRGTANLADGLRDVESIALISTPNIGLVPRGFYTGVPQLFAALYPEITSGKPLVVGGHSLGAAHMAQCGGEIIAAGGHISRFCFFGCPTPGGEKLKYIWSGTAGVSYRNLYDLVTYVPRLPSLTPIRDFTHITVQPDAGDDLGLFAPHRMKYYYAGLTNGGSTHAA